MIPHTPQCFASHMGLWAIEQTCAQALYSGIRTGMLKAETPAPMSALSEASKTVRGIRVIPVSGVMMRGSSKYGDNTSTVALRQELLRSMNDSAVLGIALVVNSPGGHASGMEELVDTLVSLSKPWRVYGQDMVGSAAYWMSSNAEEISVSAMTSVGSIGTFTVLQDVSKALDAEGVQLTLVSSGGQKGLGADGKVTQDLVDEVQKLVNFVDSFFSTSVQQGRGLTDEGLAAVHTGSLFTPAEAQTLGLIDHIESFDSFLNRFVAQVSGRSRTTMANLAIAKGKL